MSTRGEHLVRADRRFATGGSLVARLSAPAISRVLEEIDKRLSTGESKLRFQTAPADA